MSGCHAFLDRLDDLLCSAGGAALDAEAREHVARCAACREIWELARSEPAGENASAPPSLVPQVLARTSGSPCESLAERLVERVDGLLGAEESALVDLHLETCEACAALERALETSTRDLATMVELAPPDGFREAVLATTAGRRTVVSRGARLRASCRALWRRPRIAVEAAYVAASLLVLAFGPTLPLAAARDVLESVPSRVQDRWRDVERVEIAPEAWGKTETALRRTARSLSSGTERAIHGVTEGIGTMLGRRASEMGEIDEVPEDEAPTPTNRDDHEEVSDDE